MASCKSFGSAENRSVAKEEVAKEASDGVPAFSSSSAPAVGFRRINIQNLAAKSITKLVDTSKVNQVKHLSRSEVIGDFFTATQKLPPLHRVKWIAVEDVGSTPASGSEEAEGATSVDAATGADTKPDLPEGFLDPEAQIPDDFSTFQFVISEEIGCAATRSEIEKRVRDGEKLGRPEPMQRWWIVDLCSDLLQTLSLEQARSLLYDTTFTALPEQIAANCLPCQALYRHERELEGSEWSMDCFRVGQGTPSERWSYYWNLVRAVWELPDSEWAKLEAETGGVFFTQDQRQVFATNLLRDLVVLEEDIHDAPESLQAVSNLRSGEHMIREEPEPVPPRAIKPLVDPVMPLHEFHRTILQATKMTRRELVEWMKNELLLDGKHFGLTAGWKVDGRKTKHKLANTDGAGDINSDLIRVLFEIIVAGHHGPLEENGTDVLEPSEFWEIMTAPLRLENLPTSLRLRTHLVDGVFSVGGEGIHEEVSLAMVYSTTRDEILTHASRMVRTIKSFLCAGLSSLAEDLTFLQEELSKLDSRHEGLALPTATSLI
ncbi:unnamed protein product [Amoebophrya sp. A120]|nr:unnamed protein product [Amoebophrya sp. A120]|eukprot:GSA120T00002372001.1